MTVKLPFFLHQCVEDASFEKIAGVATSMETWQILEACIEGAEKIKKVRLQTMWCQYKLIQMRSSETIA